MTAMTPTQVAEEVAVCRCAVCDRAMYEANGSRHVCFYFLE